MTSETGLPFPPNPESDRLYRLAQNIADGLIYSHGGPFTGLNRLSSLRTARIEADHLDASSDFLNRLDHIIKAIEALDGTKRRMSKRDARITLDIDVPRMTGSASWPGRRAQSGLTGAYPVSLTAKFYDRPAAKGPLPELAPEAPSSCWSVSDRVHHQKFGYGAVTAIEGNKLLIDFEKAGGKKVIDTFVEKA